MWLLKDNFERLLAETQNGIEAVYGERLVTLSVFGSVARGTQRRDSDVDLLLVCDPLPSGRVPRIKEFEEVERLIAPLISSLNKKGVFASLSPIFKTPAEVEQGGLIYLDMVEDIRILYDKDDFFKSFLERLRHRLSELGARRIWRGNAWYWDLKPDFKPGDVIELYK